MHNILWTPINWLPGFRPGVDNLLQIHYWLNSYSNIKWGFGKKVHFTRGWGEEWDGLLLLRIMSSNITSVSKSIYFEVIKHSYFCIFCHTNPTFLFPVLAWRVLMYCVLQRPGLSWQILTWFVLTFCLLLPAWQWLTTVVTGCWQFCNKQIASYRMKWLFYR